MSTTLKARSAFTSFWTDSAAHNGKPFTITGMVWITEDDGMNPEPRFDVTFADGSTLEQACAEELFEGWAEPDRPTAVSAYEAAARAAGWTVSHMQDNGYFAWKGGTEGDPERETSWCATEGEAWREACQCHGIKVDAEGR